MDNKTVFIRTDKGEEEARSKTAQLSGDIRRALLMVDGSATFGEISKRAAPSLRNSLDEMFGDLEKGGFIQNSAKFSAVPRMAVPAKMVTPIKEPANGGFEELDFTGMFRPPTPEMMAAETARARAEKLKAEAETKARAGAEAKTDQKIEAAKLKVQQETAQARAGSEAVKANAKAEEDNAARLKFEAAAKARAAAEVKARQEVEAAKSRAQQATEAARHGGEQQAAKAQLEKNRAVAEVKARLKAEYEAAQKRTEGEQRAKREAETARAQAEQVAAQARAEAEKTKAAAAAKAREENERRLKEEAEAARIKAEREVARVRAELETAKAEAEAQARARAEAEKLARQEADFARAEVARLKAEAEAKQIAETARLKAEQETIKAREEVERRAREEAEAARLKAQQEAEAARLKAEQEAASAREEAELARRRAAAEAKAREEGERRLKQEAEAARVKAEQEAARIHAGLEAAKVEAEKLARREADFARAEVARLKTEQEAIKAREEAEQRARKEAEAARLKAEQEAARARADLEMARAKAEAEDLARHEAELAHADAETKRADEAAQLKADQDAAKVREEFEATRRQEEAETKARTEAERRSQEEAQRRAQAEADAAADLEARQAAEAALLQSAQDVAQFEAADEAAKQKHEAVLPARSSSVTVLFFDVVGYTKQPVNRQAKVKKQFNRLLADCLLGQGDGGHIILDTGDGAAVGFLRHPEDALEVARQFRKAAMSDRHKDAPDLKVRAGIHLGPINVVKDVNGQSNMVGDGINDAQRVMSFAGVDQIYISRSYYDFIARLNDEYAELFQYRGSLKDKHGREHQVYELVEEPVPATENVLPHTGEAAAIKLEPFSLIMPDEVVPPPAIMQETHGAVRETAVAEPAPPPQLPPATLPAEEDKPPAKPHMPSEEDVAELAEKQAKAWAEAEQRAVLALSESRKQKAEDEKSAFRPKRPTFTFRIPWGKVGAGLFVALLIALFVGPYILPARDYANGIGQLLSARLQQPVHIGHLSGRFLPSPRLELGGVSIGGEKQIQVEQVQINFTLPALFATVKPIGSINLEGLKISGPALPQASAWLQKIAADTQYPVARIGLNRGKLEAGGIQLSGIEGELYFGQTGKFGRAKLHAEGGKFTLEISAAPENKMRVSFAARGIALPLLPNWFFDELNAKGELVGDELMIADFDSRILGGMLLGNARIDWRSGWHADGVLIAKTIALQNLSKVLGGDLDGSAQFGMDAASLDKLTEATAMKGTFAIKKGLINGIDIVETARLRSRENLPGGRTHFDELGGSLSVANGAYAFRQLKMDAGVLKATGALDIARQQLSGRISADLAVRARGGPIELQVGGTTESPTLRTAN